MRQYQETQDETVTYALGACLRLLAHVLLMTEPVRVFLAHSFEQPLLVWTDACWEPARDRPFFQAGLGGLVRDKTGVFHAPERRKLYAELPEEDGQ